jgi:putative drug exporter of the RND superfamily
LLHILQSVHIMYSGLSAVLDSTFAVRRAYPCRAALLGKWFWWPQIVRQRPVPSPWPTPAEKAESLTPA